MKRPDIAALMEKLSYKKTEANEVFSVLRKMFNMAEVWGIRPDGANPCRHIPMYLAGKPTHLISDEEMGKLFRQLDLIEAEGLELRHSFGDPPTVPLQAAAPKSSACNGTGWTWAIGV